MQYVVVDPEVPAEVADLFRQNGPLLSRIRSGWTPKPPAGSSKLAIRTVQVGGAVAALCLLSVVFLAGGGHILMFVTALLAFVAFTGHLAAKEPLEAESAEYDAYRQARWYEGRYLLPEDFDHPAELLRERTRQAVGYILNSEINGSGMLDDVRNSVMLPAQEWEISRLLAKLSALRSEHRRLIRDGNAPEVIAAMEPLERALRAHQQVELLRSRLPRYEELLAETGADASAVPEIDHLSRDAGRLEQALRDSVRSAHEAFRYLDGPAGD